MRPLRQIESDPREDFLEEYDDHVLKVYNYWVLSEWGKKNALSPQTKTMLETLPLVGRVFDGGSVEVYQVHPFTERSGTRSFRSLP